MPENTTGCSEPTPLEARQTRAVVAVEPDPVPEATPADATVSPTQVRLAEREEVPDVPEAEAAVQQIKMAKVSKGPDTFFSGLTLTAGFLIVAIVAFIAIFLTSMSAPSLARNQANFLTSTEWSVTGDHFAFGILKVLWTTVYISFIALIVAVPIAIGVALLISQYLPPKAGRLVGFLIDLLAAVPSIIYGLWGLKVFGQALLPAYDWMGKNLGFIPLFKREINSAGNVLTASLVLAIMILPIITAITRDVFAQTPRDHIEAALALGSTRWEVIKTAVIPYGRSGMVAASMLGLGRALGETVAVMIILSSTQSKAISASLFQGGETFASKIASASGEFDEPRKTGAYIAAGLVLFVVTFIVNALARIVADRGKAKS